MQKIKQFCTTAGNILLGSGIFLAAVWFYFDIPFSNFGAEYCFLTFFCFLLWALHQFFPNFYLSCLPIFCAGQFRRLVNLGREQWALQYQGKPFEAAAADPFPISSFLEWSVILNILLFGFFFYYLSRANLKKLEE